MVGSQPKPSLQSLFPAALLLAPKPTFAIAGVAAMHEVIAEQFRSQMTLNGSSPTLTGTGAIFDRARTVVQDPLANARPEPEAKGVLRADLFLQYQQHRPAVLLTLVERTSLTGGPTAYKQCMDDLRGLYAACVARQVTMVIAVLDDKPPPTVTLEEFQSIMKRDLHLDAQHVIHLLTPAPTDGQMAHLGASLMSQAMLAYVAWQARLYRKMQQLATQSRFSVELARTAIKLAHICEFAHKWSSAKEKYMEGYKQLRQLMDVARLKPTTSVVCELCRAACWIHLKLVLYSIGGGQIQKNNVQSILSQWQVHRYTFCNPIKGGPVVLASWHAGWRTEQHRLMLLAISEYLKNINPGSLPLELSTYYLLSGSVAASMVRQSSALKIPESPHPTISLDYTQVQPSKWLGHWTVPGPRGTRRELTDDEVVTYLAHVERGVNNGYFLASLLQESIDNIPGQGDPDRNARSRRLALSLYTQKAEQLVIGHTAEQGSSAASAGSLIEASALLLQAAVQFRKDGWTRLLANTLQHLRTCTAAPHLARAHTICSLELSCLPSTLTPQQRNSMATESLSALLTPTSSTPLTIDQATRHSDYIVQWTNMSGDCTSGPGGVVDHGWLNVINASIGFVPAQADPDDVTLAIAFRNQLPGATPADAAIPLQSVSVTIASDQGYMEVPTTRVNTAHLSQLSDTNDVINSDLHTGPHALTIQDASWTKASPTVLPLDTSPNNTAAPGDPDTDFFAAALEAEDQGHVASEPTTEKGPCLLRGQWQVYAAQFRSANARQISVQSVVLTMSEHCRLTFLVSNMYAPSDPTSMPFLLTGCPANDSFSLTGSQAPFAGVTPLPEAGTMALNLQYDMPPPHVSITSAPRLLVGEPSPVAICVTSLGSIGQAKVTITARAIRVTNMEPVTLKISSGEDPASAVLLPGNGEVAVPTLAKGESHTLQLWVVSHIASEVNLAAVVSYNEGSSTSSLSKEIAIDEPFRFDAKFLSPHRSTVLLKERQAPGGGIFPVAPSNIKVAAGEMCIMDVLVTASAPCTLNLSDLELTGLAPGWTVSGSSVDKTLASGVRMRKNDVHTVVFFLKSPDEGSPASLGTLKLQWARISSTDSESAPPNTTVSTSSSPQEPQQGAPLAASNCVLEHALPPVMLCDALFTATLHPPALSKTSAPCSIRLAVRSKIGESFPVSATMDPSKDFTMMSAVTVEGSVDHDHEVELSWTVQPLHAGCCLLPVVRLECQRIDAMCRMIEQHVWVESM